MPDLWGTPKAVIVKAAERIYGQPVQSVQPLSTGLWCYVMLRDGREEMVSDTMVTGHDWRACGLLS